MRTSVSRKREKGIRSTYGKKTMNVSGTNGGQECETPRLPQALHCNSIFGTKYLELEVELEITRYMYQTPNGSMVGLYIMEMLPQYL